MQSPLSGLIYHTRGNRDRLGCGLRLIACTIRWGSQLAREKDSWALLHARCMYLMTSLIPLGGSMTIYESSTNPDELKDRAP